MLKEDIVKEAKKGVKRAKDLRRVKNKKIVIDTMLKRWGYIE